MRNLFIGLVTVLILFSSQIISPPQMVNAQETMTPYATCENTTLETDCIDKAVCISYSDCVKCLKRLGYNELEAKRDCKWVWIEEEPITSEVGRVILILLIIGIAIYLMRKRVGLVKS